MLSWKSVVIFNIEAYRTAVGLSRSLAADVLEQYDRVRTHKQRFQLRTLCVSWSYDWPFGRHDASCEYRESCGRIVLLWSGYHSRSNHAATSDAFPTNGTG